MDDLPYYPLHRVRCIVDGRAGWVVAASCQPQWVVGVKMDDTGSIEPHAAGSVIDEPPEVK